MGQSDYEQTWLSFSGICDRLRLPAPAVRQLVRKGCLAVMGKQGTPQARYLDPTPEYREQLRLGAIIHQRHFPLPGDLSEKALLTKRECAVLLGMSDKMMERYVQRHCLPSVRVNKCQFLYSPMVVREAMLKRSKRTQSRQRAPFLLSEMIEFFRSRLSDEVSLIPTDKEFVTDDKLQRRLAMIVTEAQKADFAQKVKLAQEIVQILEQAKGPLNKPGL